jgi:hypothetical protein
VANRLEDPVEVETVGAEVFDWRLQTLLASGYDPDSALSLAGAASVDLHVAVELVERGCSPTLAVQALV